MTEVAALCGSEIANKCLRSKLAEGEATRRAPMSMLRRVSCVDSRAHPVPPTLFPDLAFMLRSLRPSIARPSLWRRYIHAAVASALMLTAIAVVPQTLKAQSDLPAWTRERLRVLDDSVRALTGPGSPGVALGLVSDGRVVHTLYAGEADLSHAVPVGPATRFNVASNAKQFTANIVRSLIDDGRLTLDRSVQDVLPKALPLVSTPVTVRQLLTHSSGLRDVYDLWALIGTTWWRSFVGNAEALQLLAKQRGLNFTPGTDYQYSNSNYLLLVAMVAAVTDSSFADVSANRLRSWGLPNSVFQTDGMQVIPQRARPYGRGDMWQEYPAVTAVYGDGGLFTTLPDQLAWERRIQEVRANASATESDVAASQRPVSGAEAVPYGYGLEFETYAERPLRFHDGSTGAYNATMLRFDTPRLSVVVMSNNGSLAVHALAAQYADAVLAKPGVPFARYPAGPSRVEPSIDVAPWLGEYRASTGARISLVQTDSGLVRRIAGSSDVRLLPDSGNVFRYASNAALKMALDRDATFAPRFTIYLPTQRPNVGVKLPPATRPVAASAWIGEFVNDETGATLRIAAVQGERVEGTLNGNQATGVVLRGDLISFAGYELQAETGANETVSALLLSGGRIRQVKFRRRS
jgi:CubicO group peptidase (beta-lactamase class C family)